MSAVSRDSSRVTGCVGIVEGEGGRSRDQPEAVPGCLAAGKERGGFGGGVDGDGGVGESGGTVRACEGGDGEEVVVEVSVKACEARDRVGMMGKAEGASGGGPKDRAIGEIEGGRGDETRGKEGG